MRGPHRNPKIKDIAQWLSALIERIGCFNKQFNKVYQLKEKNKENKFMLTSWHLKVLQWSGILLMFTIGPLQSSVLLRWRWQRQRNHLGHVTRAMTPQSSLFDPFLHFPPPTSILLLQDSNIRVRIKAHVALLLLLVILTNYYYYYYYYYYFKIEKK